VAFANLLHATGCIERDTLHDGGIVKVRDPRIIKSDVAVFPETDKSKIDGSLTEELRIALDLGIHIASVSLEIVHPARVNYFFEALSKPAPKT
jgi:hypothetical protein